MVHTRLKNKSFSDLIRKIMWEQRTRKKERKFKTKENKKKVGGEGNSSEETMLE